MLHPLMYELEEVLRECHVLQGRKPSSLTENMMEEERQKEYNQLHDLRREAAKIIAKLNADLCPIDEGDIITIETPTCTRTGVVQTASNLGRHDGWYIEFSGTDGKGAGYWKQGSDGGYISHVQKGA